MENFGNMFSLGGGGRATDITQGGRTNGTQGTTTRQRHSSFRSEDQWDDTGVPFRDDTLAPSVSSRFRAQREQTTGDLVANDNVFALGGGGGRQTNDTLRVGISASEPPREILQWPTADEGGEVTQNEPPNTSVTTPNKATTYSGMTAATQKGGLGTPATIIQELTWQRSVGGIRPK